MSATTWCAGHRNAVRRATSSPSSSAPRTPRTLRPLPAAPQQPRKCHASFAPLVDCLKRRVQTLVECILVDHVRPGALDLLLGHLVFIDNEDRLPQGLLHDLLLHHRVVLAAVGLSQRGAAE